MRPRIVCAMLGLIVSAVVVCGQATQQTGATGSKAPAPPRAVKAIPGTGAGTGVVDAKDLQRAYTENEAAAEKKYTGRRLTVSGLFYSVQKVEGGYELKFARVADPTNLKYDPELVVAKFPVGEADNLAELPKRGVPIRVSGLSLGRVGGGHVVTLEDCKLLAADPSDQPLAPTPPKSPPANRDGKSSEKAPVAVNLGTTARRGECQSTLAPPSQPALPVTPIAGKLAAAPVGLADVIALPVVSEPERTRSADLVRELVRQAVWVAAREEFGLRVCDGALGEPAPADLPPDRVVKVYRADPARPLNFGIAVGPPERGEWVWYGMPKSMGAGPTPITLSVVNAEAESRGLYADCLKAARFESRPSKRSEAGVPAEAVSRLGEMREVDQFAAVRVLHAEVRAKGESDVLVAALSRGYANLGLLTEYQWSPSTAVFHARAMLYAQRLVARSPKSAAALRTRAYAFAMAGLHVMALADLEAASKLAAESKEPAPDWLEALDAYLHFDLDRLAAARRKADAPLVRLLGYLAVEEPLVPVATVKSARSCIEADPECYRVFDGLCRTGGVSTLHGATRAWAAVFARAMPARIGSLPDLPKAVRAELGGGGWAKVADALRKSGHPSKDNGEPSWAALATVAADVRFAAAWHRLYFMAHAWGVDTAEEAEAALSDLGDHPLRPLVESFLSDHRRNPAPVLKKLTDPSIPALDLRAFDVARRLGSVDRERSVEWGTQAMRLTGRSYQDMARRVRLDLKASAVSVAQASPHAPLAAVQSAASAGGDTLADLEKRFAGFAIVQEAIAIRHEANGRPADAARCWDRRVKLSPDGSAFHHLADLQLKGGDETGWLKTLEASLDADDAALWHAKTRVKIATHYMDRKDYKRAEPYADAAAESFAAWALDCAASCKVGLKKWGEANEIYAAAADRYGDPAMGWYLACRRHGEMDRDAAAKAVNGYLAGFRGPPPLALAWRVARFELLEGRPKGAVEQFSRIVRTERDVQTYLFFALAADEVGDKVVRDRELDDLAKLGPDPKRDYETLRLRLAGPLRDWSAKGAVPDAAAVEGALKGLSPADRADAAFFLGWFMANRGAKERATLLWAETLKADEGGGWLKTHAKAGLERQGKVKAKSD